MEQHLRAEDIDADAPEVTVSFRVRPSIYVKYHRLPRNMKRHVKNALIGLINAFYQGKEKLEGVREGNVVLNLNLNINEARAEARPAVNVNIDVSRLVELLDRMLEDMQVAMNALSMGGERNMPYAAKMLGKAIAAGRSIKQRLLTN